jgi:hypothetical protein
VPAFKSLAGQTFGRLTVLERAANAGKKTAWTCRCECGKVRRVHGHNLVIGKTRSCGCLNGEIVAQGNRDRAEARGPRIKCRECGELPSDGRLRSKTYCASCSREREIRRLAIPGKYESDLDSYARWRRKLKLDAVVAYGGVCACCAEGNIEFLCIDHVNGDGASHRRSIGGKSGHAFYLWLRRNGYPKGMRVLCYNCNMALWLYGACPHGLQSGLLPALRLARAN